MKKRDLVAKMVAVGLAVSMVFAGTAVADVTQQGKDYGYMYYGVDSKDRPINQYVSLSKEKLVAAADKSSNYVATARVLPADQLLLNGPTHAVDLAFPNTLELNVTSNVKASVKSSSGIAKVSKASYDEESGLYKWQVTIDGKKYGNMIKANPEKKIVIKATYKVGKQVTDTINIVNDSIGTVDVRKDPTCEADGYTGYVLRSVYDAKEEGKYDLDDIIKDNETYPFAVIPAIGHNYSFDGVSVICANDEAHNLTLATETLTTSAGYSYQAYIYEGTDAAIAAYVAAENVKFRQEAAAEYQRQQEEAEAQAEYQAWVATLVKTNAVEATCEAAGSIEYYTDPETSKIYRKVVDGDSVAYVEITVDDIPVAALGHNYVGVAESVSAPDDDNDGTGKVTFTCSRNEEEIQVVNFTYEINDGVMSIKSITTELPEGITEAMVQEAVSALNAG